MLLHTEHLTKNYGAYRALDDLTLDVRSGEIFGLLGPNGSGKSTALRLVMGFLRPTAGRASIAGHDCWYHGVRARRQVGYLPGELRLYENMTGRQLVVFLSRVHGQKPGDEIDRLARRFDIDLNRPIAQLSSGMKRKVALLQVLATKAPLLILDEPTNTLDPTMRDELLEQLRATRDDGRAVLFSSHVLAEVERVCDRVGILHKGKLAHVQIMAELREARRIELRLGRPDAGVPSCPGVRVLEQHDGCMTLEYSGPLPPLLDWLARQPVLDLRMEPLGLSGIYRRYHGADD